ncbi:hypothetical protein WH95_15510 [Kiloniella litopenaei]|uniref:HTH gntR-type domain-containing protein n=1 Tax=Kiloniella litopenaei TaxID=1549748 RepID=A0A0M2R7H3_9PROT|nr:FadR/GntR family transcriptional regulator [Kiloniella litopenaei]KKJ75970.1 hypothetical protein WH95_15510 [Kiloniella litopenaei]
MNKHKPEEASRKESFAQTILVKRTPGAANLFEETVGRLGKSIKLGLVSPGEQLPPERELSEMMGISRTTVRSAIQVLVEGGFLTVKRGRGGGTFVAEKPPQWSLETSLDSPEWDEVQVKHFLDKRFIIETGVCELVCTRIDDTGIRALREKVGEMTELVGDFTAFRASDIQFHILLGELTGNSELVQMCIDTQSELDELLNLLPPSKEALLNSNQQHADIVARIAKGDAVGARQAMGLHVSGTTSFLGGLLPR